MDNITPWNPVWQQKLSENGLCYPGRLFFHFGFRHGGIFFSDRGNVFSISFWATVHSAVVFHQPFSLSNQGSMYLSISSLIN